MDNTIDKTEASLYEIGSCSFVMSLIYKWFPKYFEWVRNRRYKRYIYFLTQLMKTTNRTTIDISELMNEN